MNFQTALLCLQSEVSIKNITGPVTLDWVGVHVNISPFEEWLKISPKNIIGSVASSYQANLVIEIPNINEIYINSHVFTCRHWVYNAC